jgi:hypothetical protein
MTEHEINQMLSGMIDLSKKLKDKYNITCDFRHEEIWTRIITPEKKIEYEYPKTGINFKFEIKYNKPVEKPKSKKI